MVLILFLWFMFIWMLYGIFISYKLGIPYIHAYNIFVPVEYSIEYVSEFDRYSKISRNYFKIYWNFAPFIPVCKSFFTKTSDKILHIENDFTLTSNYFLTYSDAEKFIKSDRYMFYYKINTENKL